MQLRRLTSALATGALAIGITAGIGTSTASAESDFAGQLQMAATALAGPVQVSRNSEGQAVITVTNRSAVNAQCVGLAIPYSTVVELELGANSMEGKKLPELLVLVNKIHAKGDTAGLTWENGKPIVKPHSSQLNDMINGMMLMMLNPSAVPDIAPGKTATWTSPNPGRDAVAIIQCTEAGAPKATTHIGIEPSILVGQLAGKLGGFGSLATGSAALFGTGSLEALLPLVAGAAGGSSGAAGNDATSNVVTGAA